MEHTDQILQYLKTRAVKVRSFEIIKQVGIPSRRAIFKALLVLRKRGLVKKEGFHPKIFYSLTPAGYQTQDSSDSENAKTVASVNSRKVSSKVSTGNLPDLQAFYLCQNELNKTSIKLKSALADIEYKESIIVELKGRMEKQSQEIQRLRNQILGRKKEG